MKQDFYNLCDKSYDEDFNKVKLLGRYPWVGKDYKNRPYHVLIIGDSHYAVDNNGDFCLDEYLNFINNYHSTREIVSCVIKDVINKESTWTMYRNLINTFTSYTLEEVKYLWSNVAFYNFIQRPMEEIHQEPNKGDNITGWVCFNEIINILKPDFCLFFGKRSENEMTALESLESLYTRNEDDVCNKTSPVVGVIETKQGTKTRFRIIQHSAYRGYSPAAWYKYLCNKEIDCMSQVDRNYKHNK